MATVPVPVKSTAPSPATTPDLWQSPRSEMDRLLDSFTGRFGAMPFPPTRFGAPISVPLPAVDITEKGDAFLPKAVVAPPKKIEVTAAA